MLPYTIKATIDPGATGTLSNTVTVSGSVTDPDSGNDSATDDDTDLVPTADISVTKDDGITSAIPGQDTVTYTIVVTNNGPSDDPSVSVTDNLPADLTGTYTSVAAGGATGNTAMGSGDLAETLNMPAGSSVTYTIVATIDPGATGTLSNTVTVSGSVTDPDSGNDSATDDDTDLVPTADISVTKDDGITSAIPGQDTVTYTIVVTNNGPSDDPSVSVTDNLPADLTGTYTSVAAGGATGNTAMGSGDLAETLNMPAGSSVTYTIVATIDPGATGTLSNTVTVSGSVTDPDSGNDSATDDDTDLIPTADISVTKDDGITSAVPGQDMITYTIVVINNGPSDDPSVSVTDNLPADLTGTFMSVASGGATGNTAAGAGDLAETLNMPVGSSVTYTIVATIDPGATGTLSNTVTVSGSVTDPDSGNDSATDDDTVLMPEADIEVSKTDGIMNIIPGANLTYTIVVTNNGPSDDPSVGLTDNLPADLVGMFTSMASGGATGNTAAGGGDLAETLNMPVGSSVTYTIDATVDCDATGTLMNTATAVGSVTDPVPGNESATDETSVDPAMVPSIAGDAIVCMDETPLPEVTFSVVGGTAPFMFRYTINGGPIQTINSATATISVQQPTNTLGDFVYELVEVEDDNGCIVAGSGTVTITVQNASIVSSIMGPQVVCPGLEELPYEVEDEVPGQTYTWTFSDPNVTINNNGSAQITLDGVTIPGTLTVVASSGCGDSEPVTFEISIAPAEICVIAICTRDRAFIDNDILNEIGAPDIFHLIELIEN